MTAAEMVASQDNRLAEDCDEAGLILHQQGVPIEDEPDWIVATGCRNTEV